MHTDRRSFLKLSAGAAAAGLLPRTTHAQTSRPNGSLRLLVLGGTGFLGPAVVRAAQERGHELTLFNRGRTNTDLFPDVERLVGDRDPAEGAGLSALEGDRRWDAVIDNTGYYPRIVGASAELLADRAGQYLFTSSISAYASFEANDQDETAPVARLEDATVEDMGEGYANYGGLKVLCEEAAQAAFPDHATIVRPGYIVGPEDRSDRFTYWPVRIARGGDVLVPGRLDDPIQVIDVRDLGAWIVALTEQRVHGVFNACGPRERLGWGRVIAACEAAGKADAKLHWVDEAVLEEHELSMPIWSSPSEDYAGAHTISNARAVAAGLTFRPIDAITRDTLAWFRSQPAERRAALRAGPSAEKEAEVLAALG